MSSSGEKLLEPGSELILRTASALYRDEYSVQIQAMYDDRIRVTVPMKDGRIVLLPIGTSVSFRPVGTTAGNRSEKWTKVVDRQAGEHRCLVLAEPRPQAPLLAAVPRSTEPLLITVAGGKGGVGKSVLATNVAATLAGLGKRVCLVDAVPGSGNLAVLLNMNPRWHLGHVLSGERSIFEAVSPGPGGTLLLAGDAEGTGFAQLSSRRFARLVRQFEQLGRHADVVIFDAGTGLGRHVTDLLNIADRRLVVTTAEPHAITDAYALLRAAAGRWVGFSGELVVNAVGSDDEGASLAKKMCFAAQRYLGVELGFAGAIPRERAVEQAVRKQELFVLSMPRSRASKAVGQLGEHLLGKEAVVGAGAKGRFIERWREFWRRSPAEGMSGH